MSPRDTRPYLRVHVVHDHRSWKILSSQGGGSFEKTKEPVRSRLFFRRSRSSFHKLCRHDGGRDFSSPVCCILVGLQWRLKLVVSIWNRVFVRAAGIWLFLWLSEKGFARSGAMRRGFGGLGLMRCLWVLTAHPGQSLGAAARDLPTGVLWEVVRTAESRGG